MLVEFPCRDLLREHDIEFLKGAVLGLGETEPRPDGSKETEGPPEEGCLAGPVSCGRIHHVRLEDAANDVPDIVRASAEDDRAAMDRVELGESSELHHTLVKID